MRHFDINDKSKREGVYTCACCGKQFQPGIFEATGIPHGVGFVKDNNEEIDFCAVCIMYRSDRCIRIATAEGYK